MDYKEFHNGLLSLSLLLFIFSLTFLIGSIALKPYISLEPKDRDFIVVICFVNFFFCIYYLIEVLRLDSIFKLDDKYIYHFAKRIGIISLFYFPHLITLVFLFLRNLHNLQILMICLIFFVEILLLGLIFKEVYDLLFKDEAEKKFELKKNRELYFN